ncbi:type VI secretion system baseplate subunit TssG [Tateyamaria sp. ANG-S1]|uniref:type VI secretion system baseplate subunit TssG n=1 Tax=Tateyamaria sp. ANG-S1 TaxID=1577905 RepID=UPI0006914082|nr:type VI secretion system baseplate subunit TssG [Tateyamaria sp. ANG-S1]
MTAPNHSFDRLCQDPHLFEPMTALRLAETEAKRRGVPIHITAPPTGTLAPTAISRVSVDATEVRLEASFAGLVGPLSPLPPAWTELAAADRRRRAGGLAAFLDLFSSRLAILFARAAAKYDLTVLLQWAPRRANGVLQALNALIGLATPGLEARAPLFQDATLVHAGLLAQRTRSAVALEAIAHRHLGLPVKVQQFQLKWRQVLPDEQTCLNGTRRLDDDATTGSWIRDCAGQIRLVVGPVRYTDFLSLEQGQPRLRDLARLVRFAVGPVLDFDIQVVLDRRDIPQTRLGGDGPAPRLGWNSWARDADAATDSVEAIIDSEKALCA